MVEKPIAVTVKAAAQLVEAAEGAGLSLGVMENVRFETTVRLAHWAIGRGELGAMQMLAAISLGTAEWSPDRVVADTPWRHVKAEAGGGASIDIGVHMAHRLRYLAGEIRTMTAIARVFESERELRDPEGNVFGRYPADADDAFFALPEFENGAVGTLSFTWAGTRRAEWPARWHNHLRHVRLSQRGRRSFETVARASISRISSRVTHWPLSANGSSRAASPTRSHSPTAIGSTRLPQDASRK